MNGEGQGVLSSAQGSVAGRMKRERMATRWRKFAAGIVTASVLSLGACSRDA
jgi:hypothetical protein